jgi:hypothetical protein
VSVTANTMVVRFDIEDEGSGDDVGGVVAEKDAARLLWLELSKNVKTSPELQQFYNYMLPPNFVYTDLI